MGPEMALHGSKIVDATQEFAGDAIDSGTLDVGRAKGYPDIRDVSRRADGEHQRSERAGRHRPDVIERASPFGCGGLPKRIHVERRYAGEDWIMLGVEAALTLDGKKAQLHRAQREREQGLQIELSRFHSVRLHMDRTRKLAQRHRWRNEV